MRTTCIHVLYYIDNITIEYYQILCDNHRRRVLFAPAYIRLRIIIVVSFVDDFMSSYIYVDTRMMSRWSLWILAFDNLDADVSLLIANDLITYDLSRRVEKLYNV